MRNHDDIAAALRKGRTHEAARLAARQVRAGQMDDAVAATLFLHGARDAPEREAASAWLDVPRAAGKVSASPESPDAWRDLILALVDAGRLADALTGLRLAARDGIKSAGLWPAVATGYAQDGQIGAAAAILEEGVARFATDANLWYAAATMRLVLGRISAAGAACVLSLALEPNAAGAWLVAGVIAARGGDEATARKYFARAAELGAPHAIIEAHARLGAQAA